MKTRKIQLANGHVAIVDADDYDLLIGYPWFAHWSKKSNTFYVMRNPLRNALDEEEIYMHRMIAKPPPRHDVDHKDHDGLNNRRSNLRVATRSQNMFNCRAHRDSVSALKGVSRKRDKWRARICVNGKTVSLGSFFTPKEAHQAYTAAAQRLCGEFASW